MIDVINLNKQFDNGFTALQNINFSIQKGDLVCLLGPSGCGKSTILNLIAGLLTPSAGEINFKGKSVIKTAPKDRNIGFVFQNYALYPHMTVLENVMFPLTVGKNKMPKDKAKAIAEEYMALTSIEELSNKKPGTLSGGQQQRVAITRALVQKPEVLLLDEPLSNLDAHLRLRIREEIRNLVKKVGITAIFVTHDQEEALSISDKILVIDKGIVQQYDQPQKLYLEPANLFVAGFIGTPIINKLPVEIKGNVIDFGSFQITLDQLDHKRIKARIHDGAYTFAIRPEDVRLSDHTDAFSVMTTGYEIIGRDCIVRFEKENVQLRSLLSIESDIITGSEKSIIFKLNKAFIFDENGERVY